MRSAILVFISSLVLSSATIFLLTGCDRGDTGAAMSVSGNVEATEVDLGFKSPGRVERLLAAEGAKVERGQAVAHLESDELKKEEEKAVAALKEAEARYQELKAGSRPQEIREAEASVKAAGADLENAKKDLERAELLFSNGAISAQRHDSLKKAFDTAEAHYRAALERKALVKEGPRKETIEAALHRVEQARAQLEVIRQKTADSTLLSPLAGVVLRKNSEEGETVGAGSPVYTIGDLANPWIKVYVKEDRLGLVKLGQKAEVRNDSYPGKVYEGTVSYISSEAEFTPKNVQTKEERVKLVFGVKIAVKNINGELKPGMPADVSILLK